MEQGIKQGSVPIPQASASKRRGISGSSLKIIAVFTMLVDHFAAGVLGRYLSIAGLGSLDAENAAMVQQWLQQHADLYGIYMGMRMVGRIAFPIYCFLLVEGFEHTSSRMKYAMRLLAFAVISELPFDLLFKGRVLEFGYQNVFFTLFLGLAAMIGMDLVKEKFGSSQVLMTLLDVVVIAACMMAAKFLRTDYAAIGVVCIVVIYLSRKKKALQIGAGCLVFLWEITAPLAFIPIAFYNGKRGWNLKYFFYLFYPVHLLLLYLLCIALGISTYPAL